MQVPGVNSSCDGWHRPASLQHLVVRTCGLRPPLRVDGPYGSTFIGKSRTSTWIDYVHAAEAKEIHPGGIPNRTRQLTSEDRVARHDRLGRSGKTCSQGLDAR